MVSVKTVCLECVGKRYTYRMHRWRSILAALMLLWLPLQGYAAVAMPFCRHGFHGTASGHMDAQSLVQIDMRHVHHGAQSTADPHEHHAGHASMHHHGDSPGTLACHDCGVCHLACSPAASTSRYIVEALGAQSFVLFSLTLPPLFVPEQRTPPPLAAVA